MCVFFLFALLDFVLFFSFNYWFFNFSFIFFFTIIHHDVMRREPIDVYDT